jgi:dTDP-4-dehydrorhamnose 3,5-epimerase
LKVSETELQGVLLIQPDVFGDERGFFLESFNKERYKQAGIEFNFVQDNLSKSKKGTIRGLHYQVGEMAQGKLCYVINGKVLDVAVDIRFGSPTFGKNITHILNSQNKNQIWIPPGFAHGFSVLSEEAIFAYKCTQVYSKEHERAILYNDPEIGIDWQVKNPIVSEKDLNGKLLKEIEKDFVLQQ